MIISVECDDEQTWFVDHVDGTRRQATRCTVKGQPTITWTVVHRIFRRGVPGKVLFQDHQVIVDGQDYGEDGFARLMLWLERAL